MSARTSQYIEFTIEANGLKSFHAVGMAFYVLKVPAEVYISTEKTGEKPYQRNTTERFEFEFDRLVIRNPYNFAQTVRLWYGFGEYKSDNSEVVDAKSEAVGWEPGLIPGKTAIQFPGVITGARRQRKAIFISNLDLANDVYIRDSDGRPVCSVFPRTSVTLALSGPVEVFNPNTPAVAVFIGETWYSDL